MSQPGDTAPGAPEPTAPQTEGPSQPEPSEEELAAQRRARLEAEVARRRARDEARAAGQPSGPARPLAKLTEHTLEILRARGANPDETLGARLDEQYGAPVEDVRAHQAAVRARAWQNDLRAAEHAGLAHWTLDQLDADQHADALRRYIDAVATRTPRTLNLILTGRVGPGKTSAAIAAGNAAANAGLTVRFVKHSTYLAWLRPDGAPNGLTVNQIRTRYRTCDLLILDDLGADLHLGEASEFVQRETNELVGDRLTGERATIYTTNLTSEELAVILGARAISRIGARAYAARFDGPDRRKPVTW